jgi:hypothetical protein
MLWLLCWAEILDEYSKALAKAERKISSTQAPSPLRQKPRSCLQLAAVDGVTMPQFTVRR